MEKTKPKKRPEDFLDPEDSYEPEALDMAEGCMGGSLKKGQDSQANRGVNTRAPFKDRGEIEIEIKIERH